MYFSEDCPRFSNTSLDVKVYADMSMNAGIHGVPFVLSAEGDHSEVDIPQTAHQPLPGDGQVPAGAHRPRPHRL